MAENKEVVRVKDAAIDRTGEHSGGPVNKFTITALVGALVIYFLISSINLSAYGDMASRALGFVLTMIWFLCFSPTKMSVSALIIATIAPFVGVLAFTDVTSQLGSSSFYTIVGLFIVAGTMRFTNLGKRISYLALKHLGKKPLLLIVAAALVGALLVSFVGVFAMLAIMSSICNEMLLNMGEKPGESKFGRVLMAVLPFALLTSGTSLVGGSASGNVSSINYMLNNAGLELTYVHWAKLAYPAFIICIIPGILLFTRFFKFKAEDVHILPADYYQERLDELGPIGGSEVRWIIIIIGMIACMLGGMKTAHAALLWAMISVLPGIGVADAKKVIPALNWDVCICVCIVPLLGTILTNNGVNDFIAAKIGPLFSNLGIFPFMVLAGWIMFVLMNVMVNATHGAHALTAATLIPIAVSLGYNPLVVCFPMLCAASWFYCFGDNYIVMINGGYGWWDKKDTIIPGLVTGLCMVVAYSAIIYVIAPLWGMSFYL